MRSHSLLVFIGRFEPFHNGHLNVVKQALGLSDRVLILIGSANQPRTPKNPFTYEERKEMIEFSLEKKYRHRVVIAPLHDRLYNEEQWLSDVQTAVSNTLKPDVKYDQSRIGIIGHHKDASSYYLDKFPQWGNHIEVDQTMFKINATDIRDILWETDTLEDDRVPIIFNPEGKNPFEDLKNLVPEYVGEFLTAFINTTAYQYLVDEQRFLNKHADMWSTAPYAPTFNTADVIAIQSGHILLIQRKQSPGKDLWALPGGYLSGDTYEDAALRELDEETEIKLQKIVLRRSIVARETFDHPLRSLRGRIITVAHLIHLEQIGKGLPKVKGADDAAAAKWFPLSEFYGMENVMFEDHYQIALTMIDKLKS